MRRLGLGWLIVVVGVLGCDDVHLLEEGGGGAPEPVLQSGVVKSRLSVDGIESLYDAVHTDGLTLTNDTRRHRIDGRRVTIGPVSQSIGVDELQTSIRDERLQLILASNAPAVAVPVRLDENASVRICRFQVAAGKLTATAEAANRTAEEWTFEVVSPADISTTNLQVNPINPCPPLEDRDGAPVDALQSTLSSYVETAVQRGVGNYVSVSFLDELGLLRGTTALRRLSPFGNRRGTLRVASYPTKGTGAGLDAQGTTLQLDVGASTQRATCAPPDDLPNPDDSRPAGRVEAEHLEGRRVDAGLALAEPLVGRLLRAATLGGFMCQGLDTDSPSDARRIARHRARLEDLGLDRIPGSGPVASVLSPGELPDIDLRPRDGSLAIRWDGLTVDLYGDVAGTRVRLLSVTANVVFRLRPTDSSTRTIDLSLSTLDVQNASLQTPWSEASVDRTTLLRWTKRLLVLVFEDAFSVPLPVAPDSPLELVDTRVRSQDLLLLFRVG